MLNKLREGVAQNEDDVTVEEEEEEEDEDDHIPLVRLSNAANPRQEN